VNATATTTYLRALLADHDTVRITAVLGGLKGVALDVSTSKTRCIDLMRPRPYEVLIACERLDDGSGLELLSHVSERWPQTRRVFAAEPKRLALLRGRLKPFGLFRTLAYPIDPVQLRLLLHAG